MVNSLFHNKIVFFNTTLTFFIVLLHSSPLNRLGITDISKYVFINFTVHICQIGVPMFFFISAILFYKEGCNLCIKTKLHRRFFSLVIPYLLWNTLFVAIYYTLTHLSLSSSIMNMKGVLNSPKEILVGIIFSEYTPLWFVKNLILYSLISPILLFIISKKKLFFIIFFISILIVLYFKFQYESFGYWLPVYLLGSFIGYNNTKINHPQHSLFYIFLFIAITITSYYTIIPLFFYRLLSPIILWFLADLYIKNYLLIRFKEKQWMHYTFFIYCTHFFILNILQKLIFIYIPISSVFITSPIITIYLLIQIAKWLSNYSLYKYFTGGR